MEVVLGIPFLSLSNADIDFNAKDLTWRSYTTVEALPTISRIELIDKRKFTKAALDENFETFIMYVAALIATGADNMKVHLSQVPQLAIL